MVVLVDLCLFFASCSHFLQISEIGKQRPDKLVITDKDCYLTSWRKLSGNAGKWLPPTKNAMANINTWPKGQANDHNYLNHYLPIRRIDRAYPGPSKFSWVSLSKLKADLSFGFSVVLCGKTFRPTRRQNLFICFAVLQKIQYN